MNLGQWPLQVYSRALRLPVQVDKMSFRVAKIQPLQSLKTNSETVFHMLIWDGKLIELSGNMSIPFSVSAVWVYFLSKIEQRINHAAFLENFYVHWMWYCSMSMEKKEGCCPDKKEITIKVDQKHFSNVFPYRVWTNISAYFSAFVWQLSLHVSNEVICIHFSLSYFLAFLIFFLLNPTYCTSGLSLSVPSNKSYADS